MPVDLEALKEPIAGDAPCGPDLDAQADEEFSRFRNRLEALLPGPGPDGTEKFYDMRTGGSSFADDIDACGRLLERSRDIRLFVALGKLYLFDGDIPSFRGTLAVLLHHLREHWMDVHPQAVEGQFDLRVRNVERLDEHQSTVLPLHYAPLLRSTSGTLTIRDKLAATEKVRTREGERLKDAAAIDEILRTAAIEDVMSAHHVLEGIRTDLEAIRSVFGNETGFQAVPAFKRLPLAAKPGEDMLAQVLADRASEAEKAGAGAAPQAAPAQGNEPVTAPAGEAGEAPAAAVVAGRVTTQAAARAALEVTEGYFAVSEPSSPARLLLRQARDLMGLSFDEVLQRLAPQRLADPLVRLGSIGDVAITVEALAGTAGGAMESVDGSEVPDFSVSTRQEANALITDVAAWYRKAEPSSPIPVLLDRATELSTMDFPKLMKELVGGEE